MAPLLGFQLTDEQHQRYPIGRKPARDPVVGRSVRLRAIGPVDKHPVGHPCPQKLRQIVSAAAAVQSADHLVEGGAVEPACDGLVAPGDPMLGRGHAEKAEDRAAPAESGDDARRDEMSIREIGYRRPVAPVEPQALDEVTNLPPLVREPKAAQQRPSLLRQDMNPAQGREIEGFRAREPRIVGILRAEDRDEPDRRVRRQRLEQLVDRRDATWAPALLREAVAQALEQPGEDHDRDRLLRRHRVSATGRPSIPSPLSAR